MKFFKISTEILRNRGRLRLHLKTETLTVSLVRSDHFCERTFGLMPENSYCRLPNSVGSGG